MKKTASALIIVSFSLLLMQSCYNDNVQDLLQNSICDTSNTKYSTVISQIITTNCNTQSGCHGGALKGSISLEGYQNVKDNYPNILTRIKSGNMPKNNPKLNDCNILKIETWVNKGAQNN